MISYVPTKKYGFIKGDDGENYFFHLSKLSANHTENELSRGTYVQFDVMPTSKGLAAIKVSIKSSYKVKEMIPFIMTRQSSPKHGDVIRQANVQTHFFDSPDKARSHLKALTGAIGGNAILNVRQIKDVFSKGNYKYSVYSYSATIALVFVDICVVEKQLQLDLVAEYNECIAAFDSRVSNIIDEETDILTSQNKPDNSGCAWIVVFIILAIIVLKFSDVTL